MVGWVIQLISTSETSVPTITTSVMVGLGHLSLGSATRCRKLQGEASRLFTDMCSAAAFAGRGNTVGCAAEVADLVAGGLDGRQDLAAQLMDLAVHVLVLKKRPRTRPNPGVIPGRVDEALLKRDERREGLRIFAETPRRLLLKRIRGYGPRT